jgi:ketosteroid isomerase-like protein
MSQENVALVEAIYAAFGAGDAVVVLGRYKGVFKATGRALDAQLVHVWRVEDGKVVAFQQYTDTLQTAQVIERRGA